jgi:FkbM family methyltransferase
MKTASSGLGTLRQLPFYRAARDAFNRLFRPQAFVERKRMMELLGGFVHPGSLVFDVGANQGKYTEHFTLLGAKVVAIEPNSALIQLIKERAPSAIVVQTAVGANTGSASLLIGGGDENSTLSDRYADELRKRFDLRPITVPVTTLTRLANEYGIPDFVKIDVEGFEPAVLTGMDFQPRALSFEFHGSLLDELQACLTLLPDYEFRISVGNSYLWSSAWADEYETMARAEMLASTDPLLFADIYARRS